MGTAVNRAISVSVAILSGGVVLCSRRLGSLSRNRRRARCSRRISHRRTRRLLNLPHTTPLRQLPTVHIQRKVLQTMLIRNRSRRISLREIQTIAVGIGVMVDLLVDKLRYVESAMHQIGSKVQARIVGAKLEAKSAEFLQRSTGGVGEFADDRFCCGVVTAPMTVPIGKAAVAIRVITAQQSVTFVTLPNKNQTKPLSAKHSIKTHPERERRERR